MKIAERILDACDAQNARGGVVAIGTFDGVHIGHQALISRAVSLAQGAKVPCALFTFQNHPLSVLAPEHVPPFPRGKSAAASLRCSASMS